MKISLIDLEAAIEIEHLPETIGAADELGRMQVFPPQIIITSIKVKGIELISLFSPEELQTMAEEID